MNYYPDKMKRPYSFSSGRSGRNENALKKRAHKVARRGGLSFEQQSEVYRSSSRQAVSRLVIQFRIERTARRLAWFAACTFAVCAILSLPGVSRLIAKLFS
jgi:hypothetical protein